MYLFIDTETTGFPKKSGDIKQEGQARVCQIAMLLTNKDGRSIAEFSGLIKPDNWQIHESAAAVHGFSNEFCELNGFDGLAVYSIFLRMAKMSEIIIAHNIEFDRHMMMIESAYNDIPFPENEWYCTMVESTPHCKIAHSNGNFGFKWPKLDEALNYFCGKSLGNQAHDALWDVRACKDIFFKLKDL